MPATFGISPRAQRSSIRTAEVDHQEEEAESSIDSRTQITVLPIVKHRRPDTKCDRFLGAWKDYCQSARVAGLPYVGGRKKQGWFSKLLWIALFTFVATVFFKHCSNVLTMQSSYDTNTDLTYSVQSNIQFPSITLCSKNPIRRDAVCSGDGSTALLMMLFFSEDGLNAETFMMRHRYLQAANRCSIKERSQQNEHNLLADEMKSNQFDPVKFAIDTNYTLEKCWWRGREFRCKVFTHMLLNRKVCFTFNPEPSAYEDRRMFVVYGRGPKESLQLLLNTRKNETAVLHSLSDGDGFEAFVHDQSSYSILDLATAIKLSPGYHHSISLTKNTFKDYAYYTSYQNREDCLLVCYNNFVYRKCMCDPAFTQEAQMSHRYGIYIRQCLSANDTSGLGCMNSVHAQFNSQPINFICPFCASRENSVYDYQMSSTIFPAKNIVGSKLVDQNGTFSLETDKLNNNRLMVSFYFGNALDMLAIVSPKFNILDAFISIFHTGKIYLGISLVFVIEFIFYVFLPFCRMVKNKSNPGGKRQVQTNSIISNDSTTTKMATVETTQGTDVSQNNNELETSIATSIQKQKQDDLFQLPMAEQITYV